MNLYKSQQAEFELTDVKQNYMSQVPLEKSETLNDQELSKEILSDFSQGSQDNGQNEESNNSNNGDSDILEVQWKDLMVGDVVFVKKDQYFPADLLLMGSSDKKGSAYVETRNLDGESNLKTKSMPDLLVDNMRVMNKQKRSSIKHDRRRSIFQNRMSLSFDNVYSLKKINFRIPNFQK